MIKNLKKNPLVIFLLVHLVVWTCVGLVRTVMPTDTLEGIYWGSLMDLGTPKHPPLAGWITYLSYIPFKLDFFAYLTSQLFILLGFVFIYKIAKQFLDENNAMFSVILLEGCWTYSYITCYYGFNPDVVLLFMLPLITYQFYKCMYKESKINWVLLGIFVGISFLNKYQTAFLIFPMLVWALMFKRSIFKNVWFYLSIVIAFLIFLPHILWLVKYDFFPFLYFDNELTANNWVNHITAPLIFFIVNISAVIGTLIIFVLTKLKYKSKFELVQGKDKKDIYFLLLIGLVPLALHLVMGLFEGGTMRPRWGFEFLYMTAILLFYFFPIKLDEKNTKFMLKFVYIVMFINFLVWFTWLSVELNYRSRYPVATISNDIQQIWEKESDTDIKYLGGYIEWTLPLYVYWDKHPTPVLDTYGYPEPWLDYDDMKKTGVFVLSRRPNEVVKYTRQACPYLADDYEITPKEYKFFVKNLYGMKREYQIYYFVVPPMK